jgi:hypothetical protein
MDLDLNKLKELIGQAENLDQKISEKGELLGKLERRVGEVTLEISAKEKVVLELDSRTSELKSSLTLLNQGLQKQRDELDQYILAERTNLDLLRIEISTKEEEVRKSLGIASGKVSEANAIFARAKEASEDLSRLRLSIETQRATYEDKLSILKTVEINLTDKERNLLGRENLVIETESIAKKKLLEVEELRSNLVIQRESVENLKKQITELLEQAKQGSDQAIRLKSEASKIIEEANSRLEIVKEKESNLVVRENAILARTRENESKEEYIKLRELRVGKILKDKGLWEELEKLELELK